MTDDRTRSEADFFFFFCMTDPPPGLLLTQTGGHVIHFGGVEGGDAIEFPPYQGSSDEEIVVVEAWGQGGG